MDPQLKAQLKQVLAFKISTATANDYGEVSVGSVATAFCRLENRQISVERPDGTFQRTAEPYVVLAAGVATPTFESLYWLPGHSPNTATYARRPKLILPLHDENGSLDHWELWF